MYRDDSTRLDEHDRAVGAIQIADGLIADCALAATKLQGPDRPDRWRAARSLHDDYPEIWRQLDGARRVLAVRGANTTGYDELRRQVVPRLPLDQDAEVPVADRAVLDDARRALAELRLAIPGADWRAIEKRTDTLIGQAAFVRRGQRFAVAGILAAFVLAVAAWATASIPERKPDPREEMRRELAGVVDARRTRIGQLEAIIGERCDRMRVQELMKLYVMDGRWQNARSYGASYEVRCGEDEIVRKWVNAPRPPSARL